MSPASKSKSKEKSAGKAVRDKKPLSQHTDMLVNGGNNVTSSGYDPISGTFHTLETATSSANYTQTSQTPQSNGRFCNLVNELEEHIPDATTEYDSVSNNDSCSVESEDHQKDKNNSNANNASSRTDPTPISDAEKREKIRLKNEKKHQRQKERRAQELHEKCCNYITSRKLESLAQTLVGMGFTSEAATMALIHNKGRVEESAVWILEGGMESKRSSVSNIGEANVKIDIKDELSKIVEFESKFKCSKLEVEKAVVACEGDLQKTVELLKVQLKQQESATISQNLDENGANGFQHNSSSSNNNKPLSSSSVKTPPVKLLSNSLPVQLHRRDHRDFNYTKSSSNIATKMDISGAEYPSLRKVQSTNTAAGVNTTTAQLKPRNSNVTNSEVKTMREPIQLMQRPQSSNGIRQNALPTPSSNWYPRTSSPSAIDMMKLANGGLGQLMQNPRSNMNTQQLYDNTGRAGYYSNTGRPSSLAVPSSLGLFKKAMPSSTVDWGSSSRKNNMSYCDYTSVDWSLDSTPLGLPASSLKGERLYDNALHVSYLKNSRYGENGGLMAENGAEGQTAGAGASEWTSPFTEKDLFRVSRMFATSPSP